MHGATAVKYLDWGNCMYLSESSLITHYTIGISPLLAYFTLRIPTPGLFHYQNPHSRLISLSESLLHTHYFTVRIPTPYSLLHCQNPTPYSIFHYQNPHSILIISLSESPSLQISLSELLLSSLISLSEPPLFSIVLFY